jgi:hypothetical protein
MFLDQTFHARQQLWAAAEPPHIVIGNPTSLQHLVTLGRLRLRSVSVVVVDEADACLRGDGDRRDLHLLLSRKLSNTFKLSPGNDKHFYNQLKYGVLNVVRRERTGHAKQSRLF